MTDEFKFPALYRGPISGGSDDGIDAGGSGDVVDGVSNETDVSELGAEGGSTTDVDAVGTVEKPDAEARKVQSAKDREIAQYQQQLRDLMELNAYYAQLAEEASLAQVPEEDRPKVMAEREIQRGYQQVAMKEQMLMDIAKELSIRDMATKYGVDAEELRDFPNPTSALNYCKRVSALKKEQGLKARAKSGADRVEGGGSSGNDISKINDPMKLIEMGYKKRK